MEEKLKNSLEQIRPFLLRDGGNVRFIEYNNGTLILKLEGECKGCPGAENNIRMILENLYKESYKDIEEIIVL